MTVSGIPIPDDLVLVGRCTGQFAARQVVGRIILENDQLADGISRTGRVGIAGADKRGENPAGHGATVTYSGFPQPFGGCGGEGVRDHPVPILRQDQGRFPSGALKERHAVKAGALS